MIRRSTIAVVGLALALAAPSALAPFGNTASGAEQGSTKDRKEQEKDQKKKDKKFNREILYRQAVGPNVLPLGPFTISLFVKGQPYETRIRVAVQAKSTEAKLALENDKWALNGIVYPLAVRLFENGRPNNDEIRAFKEDTYDQLSARYPNQIEEVFLESLI
ncbi:MAG: hypothetical protein HQ481_14080 [Alphaproteobacteria bacterium]|nr:hypothetical protein [Alphaproteobacteria bacterium]